MFNRIFWVTGIILFLFACAPGDLQDKPAPVIRLEPGEAQTLKMSDLFDGYEVLTFKGLICNSIGDFLKLEDRIVATSLEKSGSADIVTLTMFDSTGEFQHSLGKFGRGPGEYLYLPHDVLLTPDSNVIAMDVLGLQCYALDGTLLWSKKFKRTSQDYLGYPEWMLNDSCIVYRNATSCGSVFKPEDHLINLLSWREEQLKASYFPGLKIGQQAVKDHLYVIGDSLCYYSNIDEGVYRIAEDTVTLRYSIDKGNYKGCCPCSALERLSEYLGIFRMAENNKYVLMAASVNQKYYLFAYDKGKKVTQAFDTVEDDLLGLGHSVYKPKSVLRLYNNWKPGRRQSDEYMYFYLTPTQFATAVNRLKETLTEEQWRQYRSKHPDVMKIYDELNEDSNTVVIGYRFK